jgi:S1-C subfamily serine protease
MAGEETRSNLIATGVGFLPALRRAADELRSAFVTKTVPNLLSAPIDCSTLRARSSAALLGFALLALATGPAAAIVGGAPFADQAIARHVVIIVGARNLCTGVAIAPDLVLTAAHCVPSAGKYRLVTFEGRRPEVKDVASVAAHPQFSPRADAPDLALVKLAAPVANLTPVAFSERRVPPSVGDRFIVAGFGVGVQGDRKTAGKLRAVTLVATDRPSSQQFSLIDPQKLGEAAGFGVCNGDSGGPVFEERDRALVGIVSWSARTDGEPTCGFVSGVIPLARYRYWIAETAARLGSPLEP